ncbi:MAG: TolC family protein [Chitinophagales bacterium]|nr:TolC family protein [Chitinophagales bacterium]
MRFTIKLLLTIFICLPLTIYGQDSLQTLHLEQLILLVKKYHPVVKQTQLQIERSEADIQIAKSAFEPDISNYHTIKTFDGTNYYTSNSFKVNIPAWYGIEFNMGLESLKGNNYDPSNTSGQSSYIGMTIPLIKNLVLDKRRASLQQAKVFNTLSEVERDATINNLLMEAIREYWNWVNAYQVLNIMEDAVAVNQQRFELVKKSYFLGERPAIDTIEALTQLNGFEYLKNQYYTDFQNAALMLSLYLWTADEQPYILPENIIPQESSEIQVTDDVNLEVLLSAAIQQHPELRAYELKLDMLEIERKLKIQDVLPKLDFSYNQLGKGFNLANTLVEGPIFENNFRYGLKLEIPLLFMEGRANLEKAKLKIEETTLAQAQKDAQISIKIKSYYNEVLNLKNQIDIQKSMYKNYVQLVKAEETRYQNGESSLFLINTREAKALEAKEKLIDLQTKYMKTYYAIQWSAGLLN